ncbi:MAG: hypothetical protein WC359_12540 [Dehalococcoidia bacterium]|jgi:hypothetical protein
MSEYEAIRTAFPGASKDDIDTLAKHRAFVHEVTLYLQDQGYIFGCGCKDGCPPYCTC